MNIHAKYDKGTIILDLHAILELVEPSQKREMLESISCDGEIIEFVTQQIIDRWTENFYQGPKSYVAPASPSGLDKAWREVAKASGSVAEREIMRLEEALLKAIEENCQLQAENRDLRQGRGSDFRLTHFND